MPYCCSFCSVVLGCGESDGSDDESDVSDEDEDDESDADESDDDESDEDESDADDGSAESDADELERAAACPVESGSAVAESASVGSSRPGVSVAFEDEFSSSSDEHPTRAIDNTSAKTRVKTARVFLLTMVCILSSV